MSCFQNSTYLNGLILIKFSFSINLNTSLLQIGQYGIRLGSLLGSFHDPFGLSCHNLIGRPSLRLQRRFVGEILYHITSQPNDSMKNLKRSISICPTHQRKFPNYMTPCMITFVIYWTLYDQPQPMPQSHWMSWLGQAIVEFQHGTLHHVVIYDNSQVIKQVVFIVEVDPMWYQNTSQVGST